MNLRRNLVKFVSGVAICGMIVSTSSIVFAAMGDNKPGSGDAPIFVQANKLGKGSGMKCGKGSEVFKNMLPELVKDGTITQAESDKIAAYLKTREERFIAEKEKIKSMTEEQRKQYFTERKASRKDIFTELVENNIITQIKADSIKAKIKAKAEAIRAEREEQIKDGLDTLVKKGIITKNQAEKITLNMKAKLEERKALHEKVKNMAPEEKKAYFEKIRGEKKSFLKVMVEKGELTQEQADAVRQVIKGSSKKD